MPTVDMEVLEESRRHQVVQKYEVYPLNTVDVKDYQIELTGMASNIKEDARIVQNYLLDQWVESKGNVWSQIDNLKAKTPQIVLGLSGNSSSIDIDDGDATFNFFDDYEAVGCGWPPYASNPILSPVGDEDDTSWGSVWKDGLNYHMFYSYKNPADKLQIGHATSLDGKSWSKDSVNNPILIKGAVGWDNGEVWDPAVWKEGAIWYMLYTGRNAALTSEAVGLATASSPEGVWTKEATNPVLEGSAGEWDENSAENMNLMKIGSTYYLWYNTLLGVGVNRKSGLATSINLIDWTKNVNNPIFSASGGYFQAAPFKYGSYYYLLICHYTSGSDYSDIQMYRDTNPTFYSTDREFVRVVKSCSASGWDSHDQDTPCVLTTDINRDSYPTSELWTYYAGELGDVWKTGLLIESPINSALSLCSEYKFSDKWDVTGSPIISSEQFHHGSTSARVGASTYLSKDWTSNRQWVISAWFYNKNIPLVGNWISVLNELGNKNAINYLKETSNNFLYRTNGGIDTDTGILATLGWHKYEIKADGTDTKLYIDNILIGTDIGHGYLTKIEFIGDVWAGATEISWIDELIVRECESNEPIIQNINILNRASLIKTLGSRM